jgi:hypothetical protein
MAAREAMICMLGEEKMTAGNSLEKRTLRCHQHSELEQSRNLDLAEITKVLGKPYLHDDMASLALGKALEHILASGGNAVSISCVPADPHLSS